MQLGMEALVSRTNDEDLFFAPQDEDIAEVVMGRCPPILFDGAPGDPATWLAQDSDKQLEVRSLQQV